MMRDESLFPRRRFLVGGLSAAAGLSLGRPAWAAAPSVAIDACTLSPEQEVGPYYVADERLRSDIREDRPGLPLLVRIMVLNARDCQPLSHAAVDVWHCDALGVYSGFTQQSAMEPGGPPPGQPPTGQPPSGQPPSGPRPAGPPPDGLHPPGPPPVSAPTDTQTFLRGIQITGRDGMVRFHTILPGFYPGRTNHIHLKIRVGGHAGQRTYQAGHTAHIGQLFFPEETVVPLMRQAPYSHHTTHRTTLAEDGVFNGQQGTTGLARLAPLKAGYQADLIVAVDPAATPAPAHRGFGR